MNQEWSRTRLIERFGSFPRNDSLAKILRLRQKWFEVRTEFVL